MLILVAVMSVTGFNREVAESREIQICPTSDVSRPHNRPNAVPASLPQSIRRSVGITPERTTLGGRPHSCRRCCIQQMGPKWPRRPRQAKHDLRPPA